MSKYEWERGTLVLPTAAVASLRNAVKTAALAHRANVVKQLDTFWSRYGRSARTEKAWNEALEKFVYETAPTRWSTSALNETVRQDAYQILYKQGKPTVARINAVLGEPPTSRTTTFRCDDGLISFDGRQVTWSVAENNHAVERAHSHPVAAAFFATLNKLTWTRATGGVIVGNDEYNRDADYEGGGGNYVTARFGPLGTPVSYRRVSI